VTRLLLNPLFWAITIIIAWLILITMSIASNPEGARAQTLAPQQEHSQR
jgi:hypothetical protein